MISKKGHPGLSRLAVLVRHQSRNRPLGNLKPEFQQFPMDARGSPDGIGDRHGAHQLADLQMDSRAACPAGLGQPPPVAFESLTLPSDDRLRLNEFERRSPTFPDLLQRNPKQSISIVQSWSLLVTCVDGQLMTKSEVFQRDLLVTTEKEDEESNR